jgi:tryptophan halogenase
MPIPDSLRHRLDLFKQTGQVFQEAGDVFAENNWVQVMLGQGLMPDQYHPIVDSMSDAELSNFLKGLSGNVDQMVNQLPSHQEFISNYCPTNSM